MTVHAGQPATITEHPEGSVLSILVAPRSSKTCLERMADGTLRIRLAAPPVDGAANAALLRFLADILDVPRSRLAIASGQASRRKRVVVEGLAAGTVEHRLAAELDRQP